MANRFLSNITINDEYTLPSADGDANQIIQTDGAGNLSFVNLSSIDGAASNFTYFEVKNGTGATINKGKGVMAVGTDGNSGHILIDEMIADGSVEPKYFLGVLETTVVNGGFARVISFGQLDQFDTRGQNGETWNDGNILWCDPDSAGDFTITEPLGPNVKIAVAIVLNASTNGKIQVRVQANEGVHDLHDTKITSQTDGDVLVWNDTDGVWFNDSTLNVDYTNSRVGIGTTSPSKKLDVNGDVLFGTSNKFTTDINVFKSNSTGQNGILLRSAISSAANPSFSNVDDTNTGMFLPGSDVVGFSTAGIERMRIQSNGNVGIGTTSPSAKLEVTGTVNSVDDQKIYLTESAGLGAYFKYDGSTNWAYLGGLDSSTEKSVMRWDRAATFLNFNTNGGERVRIDSSGNVGIGTTSPSAKLDLGTSGALKVTQSGVTEVYVENTGVRLKNTYTGAGWARGILTYENSAGTDYFQLGGYGSGQTFTFGYIGAAYNNNALRWYPNNDVYVGNNLGIGITSPPEALSIYGKISINDGGQSVYVGYNSGLNDDGTDNRNVGVGHLSLYTNTSGYYNTGTGYNSLRLNTTGYYNSAFGYGSLYNNTTGYANAASGPIALYSNTDGNNNTATGYQAMHLNQTGDKNAAHGGQALYRSTASQNTASGYRASFSNTTGQNNSSFGAFALNSMGTSSYNTSVGALSMYVGTSGNYNAAVGYQALYYASGSQNAALGYAAGMLIASNAANTSSDKSVFIGADSRPNAVGEENQIAIGYKAIGLGSDTVVLGNDSITTTALKGAVGIATTTPAYKLDVSGDGRFTGDVRANSFITTSDSNLKTNIKDISDNKISLKYKEYALKDDTSGRKRYGILADDIKTSYPELVHYNEKGQAGVDYISLLVKKIAELESEISTLNKRLDGAGIK